MLKDIKVSQLEALLSYMYVGEVEVKQNDLDELIKAAECLRIKGLAFPNEDPVTSESSKNQLKTSSSTVSISEKTDVTDVSSHSSSPPRKRQRKDFDDKENNNSNIEISNSLHCQQSSSFNEENSPTQNNDDPGTSPGNQIKAETDTINEGSPSSLEDRELSCQNLADIGLVDNGMDDSNEIEEDYPSFTEINIEREKLGICNDENWIDFERAGPSGLQKVSQYFGI